MGSNRLEDEKKTPPQILENIATTITPRTLREPLKQDFRETYKSSIQFIRKAARDLSRVIPGHIWNTFNGPLVGGQSPRVELKTVGAFNPAVGIAPGLPMRMYCALAIGATLSTAKNAKLIIR